MISSVSPLFDYDSDPLLYSTASPQHHQDQQDSQRCGLDAAPAAEIHHKFHSYKQAETGGVDEHESHGPIRNTAAARRGRRPTAIYKRKRQGAASDDEMEAAVRKLRDLEAVIREHLGTGKFFLVAAALREIDEEKLYIPAKSIYTYAKERFSFSRRTTNTYLCSASVYESLVEDATLPVPVNISHIRSLHKFPADVRRFIWKQVCESGQTITEEHVVAMTVKHETGISFSNLNNELYTPKSIISAGKQVIDKSTFDLDPASCEYANDKIHDSRVATQFYDESVDGINQPWHGDVWLSPPLGQEADGTSQQSRWFCTAEEKFRMGEISSVMVLLKVDFGTSWFRRVQNYPHCFFSSKLSFSTPTGREKCMQDESHVLVYMGPNVETFCSEFARMGSIPGWNSWSFQIQKDAMHRDLFADVLPQPTASAPCTPITTPIMAFGPPSSGDLQMSSDDSPPAVLNSAQFHGFLQNFALTQQLGGSSSSSSGTSSQSSTIPAAVSTVATTSSLSLNLGVHHSTMSYGLPLLSDMHFTMQSHHQSNNEPTVHAALAAASAFSDNPYVDLSDELELRRGLESALPCVG
ncbi:hypothetical protein DFJ77DRAFT_225565 [Powellomyces hirtus]|nr:hypothetical protein DFJ77DRAFT_225565 [Powellomyces hirtus]